MHKQVSQVANYSPIVYWSFRRFYCNCFVIITSTYCYSYWHF